MIQKYDTARLNAINIIMVAVALGFKLKRRGKIYAALCPFHADKNASLGFYHNEHENHAHCFGCGKNLSVIDLVMETQGIDFNQACEYLCNRYGIARLNGESGQPVGIQQAVKTPVEVKPVNPPLCFLDPQYVEQSFSRASVFVQWLERTFLDSERLAQVLADYRIGATRKGEVIFWQIDLLGRVRSGKLMPYLPNGHRTDGRYDWIHSILKNLDRLPKDWILTQCFFGEHLIDRHPNLHIMVVESEKTAVVMAYLRPDLIWIATGGSEALNNEKLIALKGREVTFMPDSGKYDEWRNKLREMPLAKEIKYNIDKQLEPYEPNTDIVDILLGEAKLKEPAETQPSAVSVSIEPPTLDQTWQQMKANNPALEMLQTSFDLVLVGGSNINKKI